MIVDNTWNDCPSDHEAAKSLAGNNPKSKPPLPPQFAPAPGAGGAPLAPVAGATDDTP